MRVGTAIVVMHCPEGCTGANDRSIAAWIVTRIRAGGIGGLLDGCFAVRKLLTEHAGEGWLLNGGEVSHLLSTGHCPHVC